MEINTSLESNNQNIPVSLPNNPYKLLFFIFFCLFLITTTCLVTLYISQTKNTSSSISESLSTPSPTTVPTVIPTASPTIDTSSWKTYTNLAYKYSIKNPQTWGYDSQSIYKNETSFYVPGMDVCHHRIFCYKNFNELKNEYSKNTGKSLEYSSLSNYINDINNPDWKFINKSAIDNQTFYKTTSIDLVASTSYFIENNQNAFFCRIDLCGTKDQATDTQFVFSFKFN